MLRNKQLLRAIYFALIILCSWNHMEKQAALQPMEQWDSMRKAELIPWGNSRLPTKNIFISQLQLMCLHDNIFLSWTQQFISANIFLSALTSLSPTQLYMHGFMFSHCVFYSHLLHLQHLIQQCIIYIFQALCSDRYKLIQELPKHHIITSQQVHWFCIHLTKLLFSSMGSNVNKAVF